MPRARHRSRVARWRVRRRPPIAASRWRDEQAAAPCVTLLMSAKSGRIGRQRRRHQARAQAGKEAGIQRRGRREASSLCASRGASTCSRAKRRNPWFSAISALNPCLLVFLPSCLVARHNARPCYGPDAPTCPAAALNHAATVDSLILGRRLRRQSGSCPAE